MSIGILGAGQLGRMMALAGYPMGLRFTFLDKSHDAPGAQVGNILLGDFADPEAIRRLAAEVEVLTYDVENVPVEALRAAAGDTPVLPSPTALDAAQDRVSEKETFGRLGIVTAPWRRVDSRKDLDAALTELGMPAVLKRRRLGYDGRGQRFIRSDAEATSAWDTLQGAPLILEGFVDFEREISLIGVRNRSGQTAFYPLAENSHRDGILRHSLAPAAEAALQAEAERQMQALLEAFEYAGVLTVEFFEKDGRLIANEMAPRVHNSGHWTIEGAATSQFENHLRGILDLPLGDTRALGHAAMINFIGGMPSMRDVLALPGVHFHDYGKTPRPKRKLGHATIVRQDRDILLREMEAVLELAGRAEESGGSGK
jgi:5-(carboxyamino)imidazole ribonucleotide synthase